MDPLIRAEWPEDRDAIRKVHEEAFGRTLEARIVDMLWEDPAAYVQELSLVAEAAGRVLGHVISSRGLFEPAPLAMLGPIGVLKAFQRQAIGSALIERSIEIAREQGFAAIVLIGHPTYYPRFGFRPASQLGLSLEYKVPDDVAMVLPLDPVRLSGVSGIVRYPSAFAEDLG